MNFIKKSINNILKQIGFKIIKNNPKGLIYTKASTILEIDYGHLLSKNKQEAIDTNNNPIPWFTYPSIDYLRQLDLSNKIMLEWGSGNSSLFFAQRVKELYSIDHNIEWYEKVKQFKIKNQTLVFADTDYELKPKEFNVKFDIILIDGVKREACSKEATKMLNNGGLIILDNSDRHPEIANTFRDLGFIEVDFHGLGPINDYTWTTSIFMHREFNFNPITIQPTIPIGGGF